MPAELLAARRDGAGPMRAGNAADDRNSSGAPSDKHGAAAEHEPRTARPTIPAAMRALDSLADALAPPPRSDAHRLRPASWALLAALLAVAAWRLHLPAFQGSNLAVVPDAVEYAVTGQRLAELGSFDLVLDGRSHPPKVAPGFPVLFLAPLYALLGSELGHAIYLELGFALVALAAACLFAPRLGGPWAALGAGAALLLHPTFERWSREVMTDIPSLALGLWAVLVSLRAPREWSAQRALGVGLLIGCAFALRVVYLALLAPALLLAAASRERARNLALLAVPAIVVWLATLAYNQSAFGDPWRTGYHYWGPVPYDYAELVLSPAYLAKNCAELAHGSTALPIASFLLAGAWLLRTRETRGPALALALAALPISLFHLHYYYVDERFHLPLLAAGCILGPVALARALPAAVERFAWLGIAPLACLAVWPAPPQDPMPGRRSTANALARLLPEDAVVITAIDPVYLEPYLLRGTRRRVIPASRAVPYANVVAAPRRVDAPVPAPVDAFDKRCPGLLAGGAIDAVMLTAVENTDAIVALVRSGARVYIDLTMDGLTGAFAALQRAGLAGTPVQDKKWLLQLRLR